MTTSMRRAGASLLAAGLFLAPVTGCMHAADRAEGYGTRAPRKTPSVEKVPVRGYRVRLRFDDGSVVVGELLAAEPGGEVVVRTRKQGDQSRATVDLRRASVRTDPMRAAWLASLGGATASLAGVTLLTGYYVVVFAPIVLVGGAVALGVVAAESRVILRDADLGLLYQYARWPQGLPGPGPEPVPVPAVEPAPEPALEPAPAATTEPGPAPER